MITFWMNNTSYQYNVGSIYSPLPEIQQITIEHDTTITFFFLKNPATINGSNFSEGRFITLDANIHNHQFEINTPENTSLFWIISAGPNRPINVQGKKNAPCISLQMNYWMSKIILQLKDPEVTSWQINNNSLILEALIIEWQQFYKAKSGKFEHVFAVVKAIEDLHKAPMNTWTVALAIKATHLTAYEFKRIVKVIYGISVNELLTHQKMFLAANLLLQSQQSIAAIGATIGFNSDRNFTTSFKRHFNTTPALFRKTVSIG
jgi:AraC-like DNA-binding protein